MRHLGLNSYLTLEGCLEQKNSNDSVLDNTVFAWSRYVPSVPVDETLYFGYEDDP